MTRLLVVDATPVPRWKVWQPEPWFQAGGYLADFLDEIDRVVDVGETFQEVVFARSPADVYAAIEKHRPSYVEVHGHGQPGRPGIGGTALSPTHRCWRHVRRVYFRSCLVAQGARGHAFMSAIAMTCDVVAHVAKINGIAHSYLVGVRRGEAPWWSVKLKTVRSLPGAPNTIAPIAPLPSWAFDPHLARR